MSSWLWIQMFSETALHVPQTQYREQIDQVKNGKRVTELPSIVTNNQPEPPAAPVRQFDQFNQTSTAC